MWISSATYAGIKVLAKICQARADLATNDKVM
jgi:hypothetical protein